MMLADEAIRQAVRSGRVVIEPFSDALVQPASYELRLGRSIVYWDQAGHSQAKNIETYVLLPGEFILTTTIERVELPYDIAARVEGKSSLGRRGLLVHCTAGWIDNGFKGEITLEFKNLGPEPITLTAGQRIAQLCFFQTTGAVRPYGSEGLGSHYQNQLGATLAKS